MKGTLLLLTLVLCAIPIFAGDTNFALTYSIADRRYCMQGGTCNLTNLTVVNETVFNLHINGSMDAVNITQGGQPINNTFWKLDGTNAPPTATWNMGGTYGFQGVGFINVTSVVPNIVALKDLNNIQFGQTIPPTVAASTSYIIFDVASRLFNMGTAISGPLDTTLLGPGSFGFGDDNHVTGDSAVGIGKTCTATGASCIAIGELASCSEQDALALGVTADSSGLISTAVGYGAISSAEGAVALGTSTTASGQYSTAIGSSVTTTGDTSAAIGYAFANQETSTIKLGILQPDLRIQTGRVDVYNYLNVSGNILASGTICDVNGCINSSVNMSTFDGRYLRNSTDISGLWINGSNGTFVNVTAKNIYTETINTSVDIGVPSGGTGAGSFTARGVVIGGTAATNPLRSLTLSATTGVYLRGTGSTTDPVWSTMSLPNLCTAKTLPYCSATNVLSMNTALISDGANNLNVSGTTPYTCLVDTTVGDSDFCFMAEGAVLTLETDTGTNYMSFNKNSLSINITTLSNSPFTATSINATKNLTSTNNIISEHDLIANGNLDIGGYLNFNSTWDDIQVGVGNLKINPASSKPDEDPLNSTFLFDPTANEEVHGSFQTDHSQQNNTPLYCHVHWYQPMAGSVNWTLNYTLQINGDFKNETYRLLSSNWTKYDYHLGTIAQVTVFNATTNIADASTLMRFRLSRQGTATNDDISTDVEFESFDCHYKKNREGTTGEWTD